jgi:hypothetical protein
MHLGWVLLCDGELDRGFALWEEGRKIFTSVGSRTGLPAYLANTALAVLAAGEVERGADLAAQARQELELYREMWNEPIVLLAEAEATRRRAATPAPCWRRRWPVRRRGPWREPRGGSRPRLAGSSDARMRAAR